MRTQHKCEHCGKVSGTWLISYTSKSEGEGVCNKDGDHMFMWSKTEVVSVIGMRCRECGLEVNLSAETAVEDDP